LFNEKPIISKWVADLYDQKVTETKDVEFLLSVIDEPSEQERRCGGAERNFPGKTPKRVLEVCCGSGRILVPLAKAGHVVTGFDADEFMLAKIPPKAEGLGNIRWRAADAVRDDWGTGFDFVVLFGNILYNIVSDMDYAKSQELFIQKAASALVPGGHVLIEYSPGGYCLADPNYVPDASGDKNDWVVLEGTDGDGVYGKMILLAGGDYDRETRLSRFTRRFELTLRNGERITQDIPCVKHFAPLELLHGWPGRDSPLSGSTRITTASPSIKIRLGRS